MTEAITGLDLVALQFRVAAGEKLGLTQADVGLDGHAIEARLYAEDPQNDFLPSSGKIAHLRWPQGAGVRVDTGVEQGAEISPWYDPMIAKIIAHGATREQARGRLVAALGATQVAGPKTNAVYLKRIADSDLFASGQFDTSALESGALKPQGRARRRYGAGADCRARSGAAAAGRARGRSRPKRRGLGIAMGCGERLSARWRKAVAPALSHRR